MPKSVREKILIYLASIKDREEERAIVQLETEPTTEDELLSLRFKTDSNGRFVFKREIVKANFASFEEIQGEVAADSRQLRNALCMMKIRGEITTRRYKLALYSYALA
ncbi:MAG: hypothetical protein ACYCQJ_06155 [Nitrososphaerales archaeon]